MVDKTLLCGEKSIDEVRLYVNMEALAIYGVELFEKFLIGSMSGGARCPG
jgi:hypothetical protein